MQRIRLAVVAAFVSFFFIFSELRLPSSFHSFHSRQMIICHGQMLTAWIKPTSSASCKRSSWRHSSSHTRFLTSTTTKQTVTNDYSHEHDNDRRRTGVISSYMSSGSRTVNATPTNTNTNTTTASPTLLTVPSGLLAIFKPRGWTSTDVVNKIKWIILRGMQERCRKKFKLKIGHGGTLDPLAEGVLVLGVGGGTKLMASYLESAKIYKAVALLGSSTDTLDNEGTVVETVDCSGISPNQIETALASFRGNISQVPPMYSALKKDGQRLYDLARQGIEVQREARQMFVYSLTSLTAFQEDLKGEKLRPLALPSFGLEVSCSGGFYVRSLIDDLAKSVNGRAHMTDLLRVKQGPFQLVDCLTQEDWTFDTLCRGIEQSSTTAGLDWKAMPPAIVGELVEFEVENEHHRKYGITPTSDGCDNEVGAVLSKSK